MRFLNARDVRRCLPMATAIGAMRGAFSQLASGQASAPARTVVSLAGGGGDFLVMPAVVAGRPGLGAKLLTVCPGNRAAGRPLIHALVVLFDSETGAAVAVLDGGALTAVRTGAVCGLATDLLARADADVAAILGAGRQGRTQLEAVHCVRPLRRVLVFDAVPGAASAFAEDMSGQLGVGVEVVCSAREALGEADIVCTATTSTEPVFAAADVRFGTHINAVGCYRLDCHEIPAETVARALVVVDQLDAAREEAGDIAIPVERGLMTWDHVHAELGDLVAGRCAGRQHPEQITLFKSVGIAIQDVAAAACALRRARRLGVGTELT